MQPLWKIILRFLRKLKIELPHNWEFPLLSTFPKHMKALTQKDICTPLFIEALFSTARIWKQPKNSLAVSGQSQYDIYTDIGILFSNEKNEILPFEKIWMDFHGIMLCEISKQRKTKTIWHYLYVESKKTKKKNKEIEPINTENRLVVVKGGGWEWMNRWRESKVTSFQLIKYVN